MKFSIITVCRNAEKTIEKTIASVTGQCYENLEYIIVDGASTDSTGEIIEKYRHKITKFISEKDNGIYDAMNKGISLSTGDYLLFLNADDSLIDEEILKKVAKFIEKYPFDIVHGGIKGFDPKTNEVFDIFYDKPITKKFFLTRSFHHQGAFIKKSAFETIGYYDLNYRISADQEWFLRAYTKGLKFKYIMMLISFYNLHGLSYENKNNKENIAERKKIRKKYFNLLERIKFV